METKYVAVLDFATGEIHIYNSFDDFSDLEQFITEKGHRVKETCYMVTENLILQIHNE